MRVEGFFAKNVAIGRESAAACAQKEAVKALPVLIKHVHAAALYPAICP